MKREKEREKSASARSFTQYRHKHSNRERKLFLMLKYLCLFEFIMLALNAEQCTIVDAIAIATAQYNGCCRFCSISLFFFFEMKREKKKKCIKMKIVQLSFQNRLNMGKLLEFIEFIYFNCTRFCGSSGDYSSMYKAYMVQCVCI